MNSYEKALAKIKQDESCKSDCCGYIISEGAAETITVGTTATGAPGTNAQVIDRTGAPNHILDFVIPSGITGPNGPMGSTGPQGLTGVTGPTGPQGEPGGARAYGGLYNAGTQLVFFTAVNDYVQIRLNQALPSFQVTPTGTNSLRIEEAGDYEITYNILLNTTRAVDVGIAVRQNGTVIATTRGSQTLAVDSTTTISFDGRLATTTIVSLNAGDILDLVIQVLNSLPAGLDAIINGYANATLTVRKLN